MLVGSSTSPTKESVPGLISLAKFLLGPVAALFPLFPSRPIRPPVPRDAQIIPCCLRPACTLTAFVVVPGKKRCSLSSRKGLPSRPRKFVSAPCTPRLNRSILRWNLSERIARHGWLGSNIGFPPSLLVPSSPFFHAQLHAAAIRPDLSHYVMPLQKTSPLTAGALLAQFVVWWYAKRKWPLAWARKNP
jgi:hypothetical protein